MSIQQSILVIDDNDINRLNLKLLLKNDYQVLEAGDPSAAEQCLAKHRVDLVVLDLALPPEPDNPEIGLAYLCQIKEENPDTPVVVITGHDQHELALRAQADGALGFFGKPFNPDDVKNTIDQAMQNRQQALREEQLRHALDTRMGHQILGKSAAIQSLCKLITQVAPTPSSVLIRGETGVGKELVARCLHEQSQRAEHPFIAINCAAMSVEHLESELFGHEKGAFSGAGERKLGWFERANGGTLFLDEVADMPLSVQAKLLRVLEHGEFSRLGGGSMIRSDVRLICSSKMELEDLIKKSKFRDDLYYRIHVVEINVPALSEHMDDLPILVDYILLQKSALCGKNIIDISEKVLQDMYEYPWPGNVRELENVIERAVVLCTSNRIEQLPSLLNPHLLQASEDPFETWLLSLPKEGIRSEKEVANFERRLLLTALQRHHNIKTQAGRWLGFGDRAKDKMRYLCDKYDIEIPEES
ncbi:MAG: sigma-54-dependent Fis family transcriptional regulator [Zetaproteobacteria bacterium]|nr:sigma-54-dependent Fis family transcriptional regulator [Zetaproteobacteria bacterium]